MKKIKNVIPSETNNTFMEIVLILIYNLILKTNTFRFKLRTQ